MIAAPMIQFSLQAAGGVNELQAAIGLFRNSGETKMKFLVSRIRLV
jgi:hypothetical protein